MSGAGKNPFYDPDEIDDEAFLKHPKAGNSGYLLPQYETTPQTKGFGTIPSSNVGSELDQRQRLMQKKREIEERTLESSNRSLGLLYESEKVATI
jgi:synaptosomal-associated protein 29